jgi:hypothetical protein
VRQATISFPDNQQLGPKDHMCHVAEMLDFMQATHKVYYCNPTTFVKERESAM